MLVLGRRRGESIMIGDEIEIIVVTVIGGRGRSEGRVRLGITAPKNVPVHRREIYEAIQREKEEREKAEEKKKEEKMKREGNLT